MDLIIPLVCVPALIALLFKAGIFFYARSSGTHSPQTRLYLYFLFALSIQNVSEIYALYAINVNGILPSADVTLFYAISIGVIALLLHLALSLAVTAKNRQRAVLAPVYAYVVLLESLLIFTPLLISGYERFEYGFGYSATRLPGPLFFLFEFYAIGIFLAVIGLLVYGSMRQETIQRRAKNKVLLLAIVPMAAVVITVLCLLHFGIKWINASVTFPIAITYFLIVTAYAVHQQRLFDIQFFIPWSKVRKRKTAFYDRIRAMVAEIADVGSVKQAIERLADTLRCPVALVGAPKPVFASTGSQQMATMPIEALRQIDHILVANEIADRLPQVHKIMRQHGVAAVVPFYPHSQNAASWLLLGDSFSEHVYTPLDFRMVEQLFDKMAELFLDKLLAMRTQLADAHRQIQTLEFRLQGTETNVAALQNKIELLGRENLRLTREQAADTLLSASRSVGTTITITLLGRDKSMLKRLRTRFPQVEHFVGPDSSSFRRQPLPDVLICHVGVDETGAKLFDLVARDARHCAILLYGDGAEQFTFQYRKELLGSLIEVLPDGLADEAVIRKMEALVELRKSLYAAHHPDYPLAGNSPIYADAMAEAQRLAGFVDPIFIKSTDTSEAVAVAAYIHSLSNGPGGFRVLHADKFLRHEESAVDNTADAELGALLAEVRRGTLMIDNICALPNEIWDRLLAKTADFAEIRLIAACPAPLTQPAEVLFKPLQPLVLELPALRERRLDLPALVHYYTLQFNLQAGTSRYLSQADIDEMMASSYPEDLARLRSNVFDQLRAKERQPMKQPEFENVQPDKTLDECVAEFEARLIEQTLKRCGGNKSKTARVLGVRPNTLHYKLERYGLTGKHDS